MSITMVRRAGIAGAVLCGGLAVTPAAQAHDYLVGSRPAVKGTVSTAPKDVRLTFNDVVLDRPARPQVSVQGPDGRYYELGCATARGREVTGPVALGPRGDYTVTWRVVSADGHPVSDRFTFTYRPAARGTAHGAAAPLRCSGAQPGGSSPSAASSDSAHGVPTGAVVAAVGVAAVGVLGVGLIVVTHRGRSYRPDADDLDDDTDADDRD